jgi:hypothetical protein
MNRNREIIYIKIYYVRWVGLPLLFGADLMTYTLVVGLPYLTTFFTLVVVVVVFTFDFPHWLHSSSSTGANIICIRLNSS